MLRNRVVRGGVEPPTFRFSGGLDSPGESTTGRLTRSCNVLAALGVQDQPHVSTAVVSMALASSVAIAPGEPRDAVKFDHRIKSLSGASSAGFTGVRTAAQIGSAYADELDRTRVNCQPKL